MKNAIWRSRAVAILGFFILALAWVPGLPVEIKLLTLGLLGIAVMTFGFIGSRAYAYRERTFAPDALAEIDPRAEEKVEGEE